MNFLSDIQHRKWVHGLQVREINDIRRVIGIDMSSMQWGKVSNLVPFPDTIGLNSKPHSTKHHLFKNLACGSFKVCEIVWTRKAKVNKKNLRWEFSVSEFAIRDHA